MFEAFIKRIRESVYGKDVREAIAGALENAYTDSRTSADMEVIAARGKMQNLNARLNAIENSIKSESSELSNIEAAMTRLESKITGFENSKLKVETIALSSLSGIGGSNGVINEGSGINLPIFDLVEDADSLLAVIYYVSYSSNGYGGFASFPAFVRNSETTGYYATTLNMGYTGSTYGNKCDGAQLNFTTTIDTSQTMHISNDNSSQKITLTTVKAFIVTRW